MRNHEQGALWFAFGASLALLTAINWIALAALPTSCGLSPELYLFHRADVAPDYLACIGERGRLVYAAAIQRLDMLLPPAYALFGVLLARRFWGWRWPNLLPMLAAMLFDYSENIAMARLIATFPAPQESLMGWFTAGKWLCIVISIGVIIFGWRRQAPT